jgi:alpha-tubulin suppressor-like RCC1 family protein
LIDIECLLRSRIIWISPKIIQGGGIMNKPMNGYVILGYILFAACFGMGFIINADANRAPVFDYVGNQAVNEGELLQFTVHATDPDGDPPTYSAMGLPRGAVFDPASGVFSWTPDYTQSGKASPLVTFSVTDGKGGEGAQAVSITINNVEPAELIQNPGFDNGIDDWYCVCPDITTANAVASWDNVNYDEASGSLRVQCTDNGSTYKDIQLFTDRFSLVNGTTYLMTFRAKSSAEFTIPYIKLSQAAGPWVDYANPFNGLIVNTEWQAYAALFTANTTADDARLNFFLGNALPEGAVLNIDTVSLKKVIVYLPPAGELLPNPDFYSGNGNWNLTCDPSARANRYLDAMDYDTAPVSYKIQCLNNGNTLNSIQLFTMPIGITAGKSYQLSFKAKCSSSFAIPSIRLMKATSPWTNYASPYYGLTIMNDWQSYSIRFTANITAADGRITFCMGNALPDGGIFKIDSVSLREEAGVVPTVTPTRTTALTPTPTRLSLTLTPTSTETVTPTVSPIPTTTPVPSPSPTTTPGAITPMVAAGAYHSLALKGDGTVWAWGYNGNGQFGDGTYQSRSTPVQVYGLTNVKRIAAGGRMSVAVKTDGTVWVWGYNPYGLGNGMTQSYFVFQVPGLTEIQEVMVGNTDPCSTGTNTNCFVVALKKDGTVWAWGYNVDGELGDGTTGNKTTPVQVNNLTDVTAISTWRNHTLVLKNDGTVWGWGANGDGQLGNGNTTSSATPVQTYWITDVSSISAGERFSIARKSDGTVWAWGYNGFDGVGYSTFGNGNSIGSKIPIRSYNLESFISFISGAACSHGLTSSGSGWSWGYNGGWNNEGIGQIGDGTAGWRLIPVQISGLSGITHMAAGVLFTLAVKEDGTVWAWGCNSSCQLGDGTATDRYSPVQVKNFNLN